MHPFLWFLAALYSLAILFSLSALSSKDEELKQSMLLYVKFRLENRWIGPARLLGRIAIVAGCVYFARG